MQAAADGGDIARNARLELESQTGKPVISPKNAKNLLHPKIFSEEIENTNNIDNSLDLNDR